MNSAHQLLSHTMNARPRPVDTHHGRRSAPSLAPRLDTQALREQALPFVKWAGGKRALLPALNARIPSEYGRYFEPFVGGGALFFDQLPERAQLTDVNDRLIRTYRTIRDDVEAVIDRLEEHAANHCEDYYYDVRSWPVDELDDADVAAWFIYLNRTGFNGLYRVNKSNGFNVPFGRYKSPAISNPARLKACSYALRNTTLRTASYDTVLQDAREGDFVYFDPPYVPLSASANFTTYSRDGFGLAQQEHLRDVALALKERGVHILLSNSWTPEVRALYSDSRFDVRRIVAPRTISRNADGRNKVFEALIS